MMDGAVGYAIMLVAVGSLTSFALLHRRCGPGSTSPGLRFYLSSLGSGV